MPDQGNYSQEDRSAEGRDSSRDQGNNKGGTGGTSSSDRDMMGKGQRSE